jgi:di/tricarboxylate transporter
VILFGGGLVLGSLLSQTGLAEVVGNSLPVSTPPNAIVYSSGLLPITRMIKAGAVFDIIGAVLCVVGVITMANLVGVA